MDRDREIREAIVEVGRRMYAKGLIAAADGNVTVRTPEGEIYVTPSGACKGFLAATDVVVTDLQGRPLRGERRPSSEIEMHTAIYEVRPDVFAVVHAHPPLATGFAAAGVPLSPALLSEIILTLGCVPLTEYATPTTQELAATLTRMLLGLSRGESLMDNVGGGVVRFYFHPRVASAFKFKTAEVIAEGGGLKLLIIK